MSGPRSGKTGRTAHSGPHGKALTYTEDFANRIIRCSSTRIGNKVLGIATLLLSIFPLPVFGSGELNTCLSGVRVKPECMKTFTVQ